MVSIVVPVFNSEKAIQSCIESILGQTYRDIELILIDDGSSDHSLNLCREYQEKDGRVRVYSQENRGVSRTRNRGIELAEGKYIQFVDSDDRIVPDMVEKLVAAMEQEEGIGLTLCGIRELHEDHEYIAVPDVEGVFSLDKLGEEYPGIFHNSILNSPCNKLYIRDKIKVRFPENLSLGEDLIFNLEYMRKIKKIAFVKESLYDYIIHPGSLNRKYREDGIEIARHLYEENLKFCREYQMGPAAEQCISSIFIRFLIYGLSDLYSVSGVKREKKKEILKRWIHCKEVKEAAHHARLDRRYQQMLQFLIKHGRAELLNAAFQLKARLGR